ncbi:MAG: hypothetical protein IPG44_12675 [Anaerolineales bacterium]|jgi:hypothetical protein|nr:hypothetical protein [Chloroflexota bacterium]MBK6646573.1 hypothetical protein [Anaerolineales bacterium]MCC6986328.1 hypothetical protein [Anaerolineales bacterium]
MSAQAIEAVLTRAMSDTTFADMLFANPDAALAGFDLTAEEIAKIKSISRAEFENALPGQEDPTAKN